MEELKQFLAGGIQHYGDAVRTTRRFERELLRVIEDVVMQQIEAGRLPSRAEPVSKPYSRSDGPWASTDVTLDLGEDDPARFSLGLWWDRESTGHDCIIYVGCNDGPEWVRKRIEPPAGGCTNRLNRARWAYMVRPLTGDSDVHEELHAVLEEWIGAFSAARAAR